MEIAALKKRILSLAMEGKLTKREPTDEPAAILLEKIAAERERLIKEKKLKKQKPLPPIEEKKKPYPLPKGWEWVRLGELASLVTKGTTPRGGESAYDKEGIGFLRVENLIGFDKLDTTNIRYIKSEIHEGALKRSIIEENDILISIAGTLGRTALVRQEDLPLNTNQAISIVRMVDVRLVDVMYLIYALNTNSVKQSFAEKTKVTAIPNLTLELISNCVIPIPPLAEQRRIVARLEELLGRVDTIAEAREQLRADAAAAKKRILTLALTGHLLPQQETDEPAPTLLAKIAAEKERLVAAKKLKKQKPLPPIEEKEKPFDLPKGWAWVRLGELFEVNPKNDVDDEMEAGFMPMPLLQGGFQNHHTFEPRKWKEIKKGYSHFANGDIVVAKISPCFENRKSAIIENLPNGVGAGTTELVVLRDRKNLICKEYILFLCKSEEFIREGSKKFTGTVGQQRIAKDYVGNYVIALPPLAEQKRLAARLTTLFSALNHLA